MIVPSLREPVLHLAVLAILAGALLLAGCYPGGPESLDEIGLVVTSKNPEGNQSGLLTYAMEDTVVELGGSGDDSSYNHQHDDVILFELQDQMAAAGFQRVDPDVERPDAWLAAGAVVSEVWYYYQTWGYMGGYWGGGYYPPYYPTGGVGKFDQGTVTWVLLDMRGLPDPIPPDPEPVANWLGAVNGALQSESQVESGIRTGIRQAFAQSPYIAASGKGAAP